MSIVFTIRISDIKNNKILEHILLNLVEIVANRFFIPLVEIFILLSITKRIANSHFPLRQTCP